jgi:S1-C subfamily serine protease
VTAHFKFLSGARVGQVETLHKAYLGLGRHPLSDLRFDSERDLDVSARHAAVIRQGTAFLLRDLGSRNGTFVNGEQISADVTLRDGDVIGFGKRGPAVEFHVVAGAEDVAVSPAMQEAAERMSSPRQQFPAMAAPGRRSSTAVRIAAEVARQTRGLRRTTKLLIVLLVVVLGAFGWVQWKSAREANELARLQARADSLGLQAQRLLAQFQSELASVREALHASEAEAARLRRELAIAGSSGDAGGVARLRRELDTAEARQRGLAGVTAVDYRAIAQKNEDAVALVVVQFSDSAVFSGTAFAADSQGTLVTNKHLLVGESGDARPRRIAVKFSGSQQWFPARFLGVADSSDVGVLKVDIRGGTPRVAGFATAQPGLERGDPVAVIGYPLGEDLPMEHRGERDVVAAPTLTVGTVSKVLSTLVQVDGYGAPGSSGSPIFDRDGRVAALLYGGNRESQGKIIYAVPGGLVFDYLNQVKARR